MHTNRVPNLVESESSDAEKSDGEKSIKSAESDILEGVKASIDTASMPPPSVPGSPVASAGRGALL